MTMLMRMRLIFSLLAAMVCLPVSAVELPGLGVDVFRQVVKEQKGNVVFSPASLEGVLRLLKQGARGETLKELQSLSMPARLSPSAMTPAEANALFVDDALKLKPGIKVDEVISTPLLSDAVRSAEMVNDWANEKTRGMIPSIIEPSDLQGNPCMMIAANAIAFEEKWQTPFEPEATRPAPFYCADGSQCEVPMMYKTGRYTYAEDDDWEALALFFRPGAQEGEPGCFLSILPKSDARAFVASLTPQKFDSICKALAGAPLRQVRVGMPRFEQRTDTFPLANALKSCGLKYIFSRQADLTGFADAPLYLSEVLQRCYVKADEQGAKAAAVTVGVMRCWSARPQRPVPFIMDRPFIWAITDLENSTAPLFMGLCERP